MFLIRRHGRELQPRAFLALLCATLTLSFTGALAQESITEDEGPELRTRGGSEIEEVTVTARKKSESLQDVPISITALTAEALRAKDINNAYDVAAATPNFSFTPNLGRRLDVPNIRGQFGPLIGGTAPNASFFVDGVYTAGSIGSTSTANLQRVEVLRGPQSALFGRATFSGAVNYITRRPTDELEGEINGKLGEDGREELGAWFSGPVIEDKVYFFLAGNYNSWDGEWRNSLQDNQVDSASLSFFGRGNWRLNEPQPGDPPCSPESVNGNCAPTIGDRSKVGGQETKTWTTKFLFTPIDDLEITTKFERSEADDDHFVYNNVPVVNNNCFNRDPSGAAIDPRAGSRSGGWLCGKLNDAGKFKPILNLPNFRRGVTTTLPGQNPNGTVAAPAPFIGLEETVDRYLVDVNYNLNEYDLLARYSREDRTSENVRDLDRSYALGPIASGLFEAYEQDNTEFDSWEFSVQSPVDSAINWSLGYYYYNQKDQNFSRQFTGFGDGQLRDDGRQEITNKAWYGSVEWALTEKWTVSFDGRYAEDEISRGNATFDNDPTRDAPEETFYSFSPRGIVRYLVNEDLSTYFSVAQGNKPGGFNFAYFDEDADPAQALSDKATIEEEDAWTWEVGAKGSFFDDRLEANAALFYIDWTDQAINVLECIPTPEGSILDCELNNVVTNAGESRVYGAELEMSYFATDYLTFTLGYGYSDAELEDYVDEELASLICTELCYETDASGDLTQAAKDEVARLGDVEGNKAPRVPKHSVNFSSLYARPLIRDVDWYWRNDWLYESKRYSTTSNLTYAPSYWNWNSRIGLETATWSAAFYVNNITDEKSPLQIQDFPLFDDTEAYNAAAVIYQNNFSLIPRQSRNAGVTVSYRFGPR